MSDDEYRAQNFAIMNLAYPLGEVVPTLLYGVFHSFVVLVIFLGMMCLYLLYLAHWHMVDSPAGLLAQGCEQQAMIELRHIQLVNRPSGTSMDLPAIDEILETEQSPSLL